MTEPHDKIRAAVFQTPPNGGAEGVEQRLKSAIQTSGIGFHDYEVRLDRSFWSPEVYTITGVPAGTPIGMKDLSELIHPDDRDDALRAMQRALDPYGEGDFNEEFRIVRHDTGEIRWVLNRGRTFFEESNGQRQAVRNTGIVMDITERKHHEEELRKSEELLRVFIESAPVSVAMFDCQMRYLAMSQQFLRDNRITREVLGRSHYEVIPEIPERWKEVHRRALAGESISAEEDLFERSDGRFQWLKWDVRPWSDSDGKIGGVLIAAEDITDRVEAERKVRASEEKLRLATERFELALRNSPITVFQQDADLRYVWIYNPAVGYNAAEVIGKRDTDFLERREDAEVTEAVKSEVIRTGVSYHGELVIHQFGVPRCYHVTIDAARDAEGKIVGLNCASFDMTERKQLEAERERLAQQRQVALDAAHMGWWHYDPDRKIAEWDKTFKTIFGVKSDSGPREDILRLVHPEDVNQARARFREALNPENPTSYMSEYRIMREDGSLRWVESHGAAEFQGEGRARKAVSCSGTVRDITDRKEAEEALRASESRYRELADTLERQVRKRTLELQERNEEVVRSSEGLRALSSRLLQVRDEERRRVARELHDSAGQLVAALSMELRNLAEHLRKIDPNFRKRVEPSEELIQHLQREIRTTSYLLHPPLLDESGITSALQWYVEGLNDRSALKIQLHIADNFGRLPRDMELVVFRLVQESLTNIYRHSGSKTASIRIERRDDHVVINIEDQGKGMTADRLRQIQLGGSGVGIQGMRERLRPFGGVLRIESNESGTRVSAQIPVTQRSDSDQEKNIEQARASI